MPNMAECTGVRNEPSGHPNRVQLKIVDVMKGGVMLLGPRPVTVFPHTSIIAFK